MIVIVLFSRVVDRGFLSDRIKPRTIKLVFTISSMHAALRRQNKDWLARYQDIVSESEDMSARGLLFQ